MEAFRTFVHNGRVLRLFDYAITAGRPTPASGLGEAPVPAARPEQLRASHAIGPGTGRFAIERVEVSREGDLVTVGGRIAGRGVAYVYADLLLKDPASERYYGPVARERVAASRFKETRGSIRPVWDDPLEIAAAVTAGLRVLTDRIDHAFCFSTPGAYGDPTRRLEGLYTPSGGGRQSRAVISLGASGEVVKILARRERGGRFLPRPLFPRPGDRFAPFVTVLAPSGEGGEWSVATALSDEVTFSDTGLHVDVEPLMPGEYLAGLVVQDLDGGIVREYAPLTVEP